MNEKERVTGLNRRTGGRGADGVGESVVVDVVPVGVGSHNTAGVGQLIVCKH